MSFFKKKWEVPTKVATFASWNKGQGPLQRCGGLLEYANYL